MTHFKRGYKNPKREDRTLSQQPKDVRIVDAPETVKHVSKGPKACKATGGAHVFDRLEKPRFPHSENEILPIFWRTYLCACGKKDYRDDVNDKFMEFVWESNLIEGVDDEASTVTHLEAAKTIFGRWGWGGLTEANVLKGHRLMMADKLDASEAGFYRREQVFVGRHIPPSPHKVQALMDRWFDFFSRPHWRTQTDRTDAEKEALAWLCHASFEFIHPFIDGNGRMGRLLWQKYRAMIGLKDILIVKAHDRMAYYARLERFQQNVNDDHNGDPLWFARL